VVTLPHQSASADVRKEWISMSLRGTGKGSNTYLGRTDHEPRPAVENPLGLDPLSRERLKVDQAMWDEAEALRLNNQRLFNERVASIESGREAQRQSREDAQRAEARDALLKPAMAAFLASGGTQAEWDQQAPQIEAQIRQQRAVDAALGNDPVTREMARLRDTGNYSL